MECRDPRPRRVTAAAFGASLPVEFFEKGVVILIVQLFVGFLQLIGEQNGDVRLEDLLLAADF